MTGKLGKSRHGSNMTTVHATGDLFTIDTPSDLSRDRYGSKW